jgi:HEAT repeat protein
MRQSLTQFSPNFTKTGQAIAEADLAAGEAALERMLLRVYLTDLGSVSWRVRRKGANGLGELGEAATDAAPELERLLSDPDPRVREAAAKALARVSPTSIPGKVNA